MFVKPPGGWGGALTESAKLTSSDAGDEFFGEPVAVSGDTVVVGAPSENSSQGSAYLFVKPPGGWTGDPTESAKLTASDGTEFDFFGNSVAVSGDAVVVGARGDRIGSNVLKGPAYVFVKPPGGWAGALIESAKLIASDGGDPSADEKFGRSVAVSGETVVVGALTSTFGIPPFVGIGSAYVFVKPPGGWAGPLTESAKLTPPTGGRSTGSAVPFR